MAHVTLDDNKILLSEDAVSMLDVVPGDKLDIRYWTVDPTLTFPVIAKGSIFGEGEGKKLSKKRTFCYRGEQATVLTALYGPNPEFNIVRMPNGMFRMIPVDTLDTIND